MMNWLKQRWQLVIPLVMVIGASAVTFWWFQWRPSSIRSSCAEEHLTNNPFNRSVFLSTTTRANQSEERYYNYLNCLRRHGIKE